MQGASKDAAMSIWAAEMRRDARRSRRSAAWEVVVHQVNTVSRESDCIDMSLHAGKHTSMRYKQSAAC